MKYNPSVIEKKWQSKWSELNTFKAEIDYNKPKYYVLEMFPYPSGAIHMGHVRNYTLGDQLLDIKGLKGLMFFILWGGTHLGYLQKTLR